MSFSCHLKRPRLVVKQEGLALQQDKLFYKNIGGPPLRHFRKQETFARQKLHQNPKLLHQLYRRITPNSSLQRVDLILDHLLLLLEIFIHNEKINGELQRCCGIGSVVVVSTWVLLKHKRRWVWPFRI